MLKDRLLLFFLVFFFLSHSSGAQEDSVPLARPGIIDELALKDVDITDALSIISEKSGINIISGRHVSGSVTIFLKNVDAKEALRIVAESNGLAFAEEGRIIRVMTRDEYLSKYGYPFGEEKITRVVKLHFVDAQDIMPLLLEIKSPEGRIIPNEETQSLLLMDSADKVNALEALVQEVDVQTVTNMIPLKYARAEEILEDVKGLVTRSWGSITCDVKENRLIVTDTLSKIDKIRRLAELLDARSRKVMLQAKLVHIVLNEEYLDGLDWSGIVSDFQDLPLEESYDFLKSADKNPVVSLGIITEDEFPTLLEAMETVGLVKEYPLSDIEISPHEEARVVVRFDDPRVAMSTVRRADKPETFFPVRMGTASLEFFLKPVVDTDGSLRTAITTHEGPRKGRSTIVDSSAGQVIVMGGLIVTENVLTARRVPLVGDLPLLGLAFRYHNSSIRREEFVLFLTPRAFMPEESVPAPVPGAAADPVIMRPEETRTPEDVL